MKRYLLLVAALGCGCFAFGQKTYIQCGRLIDGESRNERTAVTIVVEGKKIIDVQNGYTRGGDSDTIINLSDKTVLPGLIDCHVHLEFQQSKTSFMDGFRETDAEVAYHAAAYAKATLMAGFTTVRDLGGTGVNVALRNAINKGLTDGPNILTAEHAISASGGHMDPTVGLRDDAYKKVPGPEEGVADGRDEVIKAVRFRVKNGADVIKIASTGGVLDLGKDGAGVQYTQAEIEAIVETAKDYGMRVACHAHGTEGIKRAILGGVTSIEHGTYMDNACMDIAKKMGTWLVPTLTAGQAVADSAKVPGFFPPVVAAKASAIGPQLRKTFALAYKAGVKIAFGTDAGVYPHGKNYLEFVYMTEAGMPAMEAIMAATSSAAELLGIRAERGTIATGKMADIVAVDGSPLKDVSTLTHMSFIMKEGKIYKR